MAIIWICSMNHIALLIISFVLDAECVLMLCVTAQGSSNSRSSKAKVQIRNFVRSHDNGERSLAAKTTSGRFRYRKTKMYIRWRRQGWIHFHRDEELGEVKIASWGKWVFVGVVTHLISVSAIQFPEH